MSYKLCKCGCGNEIISKWQKYQDIDYLKGHARKNRKNSLKHNLAISRGNRNGKDIRCGYCNKYFYVCKINLVGIRLDNDKIRKKKYCSKECYNKSMIGRKIPLEWVKKSAMARVGHVVSKITRDKISIANKGDKNGRWKDITILKIRHNIRQRDNFFCLMCGLHQEKNKSSLDVHHIDYTPLNHLPQNLISLCHSCHAKTNKSKRLFWIKHCQSLLNDKYDYVYTEDNKILVDLGKVNL